MVIRKIIKYETTDGSVFDKHGDAEFHEVKHQIKELFCKVPLIEFMNFSKFETLVSENHKLFLKFARLCGERE